ncbi:hypothetical protein [Acinetobacter bereziniae]|uniref:hypothetical protein n=1 Tax=Acinetobacter bereziniae TaxID=106648 RepID=UPI0032B327D1
MYESKNDYIKLGIKGLSSFDLSHPHVKALMKQRYGQHIPLNEMVIAPSVLFNSKQLIDVR